MGTTWFEEATFLDNELIHWLIAIAVFALCYVVGLVVRKFFERRFSPGARWGQYQLSHAAAMTIRRTKSVFLLAISALIASEWLILSSKQVHLFGKFVILVALAQGAIWGNTLLGIWMDNLRRKASLDVAMATSVGLIQFAARAALYVTLLLLALSNLGIDITALVTGLGISGIAVALAAQKILGDLFASLTIVLDRPFMVGDSIVVGDYSGKIEQIGLKTTRIRSTTGEQIIFSNSDLVQSKIRNFKRMQERQVLFRLGVTYETPQALLEQFPQILRELIEKQPNARFERANFVKFSDCSLDFEIVYWVNSPEYTVYVEVHQQVGFAILRKTRELGIEFAYPTRSVFTRTL